MSDAMYEKTLTALSLIERLAVVMQCMNERICALEQAQAPVVQNVTVGEVATIQTVREAIAASELAARRRQNYMGGPC